MLRCRRRSFCRHRVSDGVILQNSQGKFVSTNRDPEATKARDIPHGGNMPRTVVWVGAWAICTLMAAGCGSDGGDGDGGGPCIYPGLDADQDLISDCDEARQAERNSDTDVFPDWRDLDSDGDLIPDLLEAGDQDLATPPVDTDADGTPDYLDADSDGDGIPDLEESIGDADMDGIPDFMEIDADGDGILDRDEGNDDPDLDGLPSYLDLDSDGDWILDETEAGDTDVMTAPADSDADGTPDFLDTDSDGDLILDAIEAGDADLATAPADSDTDGIPDFLDDDSDADFIRDFAESANDSDGDGMRNALDSDSDGDGIPDAIEAGDMLLTTPPVDTDSDGTPDFLDLDSDNDFVLDREEDLNGNGMVDPCPMPGVTPCESSPTSSDTDGDGTPDLIERVAGSDPGDPSSTISAGDFFFVLPFGGPAQDGTFDFSTNLRIADIFFSVDTTGSFDEEIAQIQTTLRQDIIPGVRAIIPDVAFGVGRFEDFPLDPHGLAGDVPYELVQTPTTSPVLIQAGVNALAPAAGGLDTPESGIEALYQWASGAGFAAFGYQPFTRGGIGGVGFRNFALPIIVQITDARSHTPAEYAAFTTEAHSRDDAVSALTSIGARVIGVDSLENAGTSDDPRTELEDIAVATNSIIAPNANNECLTGVANAPRPPVDVGAGPICPLVFDVLPNGAGLGTLIVDAIATLASIGTLDISTGVQGFTTDIVGRPLPMGLTTAPFVKSVTPVPPAPAGSTISGDRFLGVTPGSTVTFRVTAQNDFLMPTEQDQLMEIAIQVLGDRVTLLDTRRVFVIVPKMICSLPIEICDDIVDNNCNGMVDEAGCCTPGGAEICGNGIDDDCDGKVDSLDEECAV